MVVWTYLLELRVRNETPRDTVKRGEARLEWRNERRDRSRTR